MRRPLLAVLTAVLLLASCSSDDGSKGRIDLDRVVTTEVDGAAPEPGDDTDAVPDPDGSPDPDGPDEPPSWLDDVPDVTAGGRDGYVEALTLNLEHDPDNRVLMGDEAGCVATAWIDRLGVERFEAAGLEPRDVAVQRSMSAIMQLDPTLDEGRGLIGALPDCGIDLVDRLIGQITANVDSAEVRACVEEGLTEEMVMAPLIGALVADSASVDAGGDEIRALQEPFVDLMTTCGV